MANEMHVLFRGPLPKKAALARALRDLGFPVTIPKPAGSLERQKGFLPMRLYREESGVEFDTFEGRDAVEENRRPAFRRDRPGVRPRRQLPLGRKRGRDGVCAVRRRGSRGARRRHRDR
jgi:hypothetical protein